MALWNRVAVKAWNDKDKDIVYAMDQMTTEGAKSCPKGYCMGLASIWMRVIAHPTRVIGSTGVLYPSGEHRGDVQAAMRIAA